MALDRARAAEVAAKKAAEDLQKPICSNQASGTVRMGAAAQELVSDVGHGPAMSALTDKQRRYVCALFEAPKSHGALTFAARAAGYGTATSSRQSLSQMAHQLNGDPKVQAAVAEVSQQYITVLGPHAVRALKRVLDSPGHRDHGRALGIVMDRVAPQNSTHTVKLEGEVKLSARETEHILERIEELARKFAVALPAPKIIEGKVA